MNQTILSTIDYQRSVEVYKSEIKKIINLAAQRNRIIKESELLVTPAILRSRRLFVNGAGNYQWDFREETRNNGGDVTDKLLANQDSFISTHALLNVSNKPTAKPQLAQLASWADPRIFPTAAGYVPGDLDGIYNGNLTASYGTQQVLNIDTELLRREKATNGATANAQLAAGAQAAVPITLLGGQDRTWMDGAYPFVFSIDGYGARQFQLTFNANGLQLQPNPTTFVTEVVLSLVGFRIVNVSQWQAQG